jgi:hypothetical protein
VSGAEGVEHSMKPTAREVERPDAGTHTSGMCLTLSVMGSTHLIGLWCC